MKEQIVSGWGGFPKIKAKLYEAWEREEIPYLLDKISQGIPLALGRSYGDSALARKILLVKKLNRLLSFDPQTGLLRAEAGVSLREIIQVFLPRGWFLPVVPGTQFVTLGGAVAADIHGKNHHHHGCFSEFVEELLLFIPGKGLIRTSRKENQELFYATCGGMGLTGIILEVSLRLRQVPSAFIEQTTILLSGLEEILEAFEEYQQALYTVSWVDCSARDPFSRAVLFIGEHAKEAPLKTPSKEPKGLPLTPPVSLIHPWSIRLFNWLYYRRASRRPQTSLVPIEEFFFPLDKWHHWNRLYGPKGFLQYQFVIPKTEGLNALKEIAREIRKAEISSSLAVLKLFGPENKNLLSFPMEGYTLALDFPYSEELFTLLERLDQIVLESGGRFYLAKDARLKASVFEKGYTQIDRFRYLREKLRLQTKLQSLQSQRLNL